MQFLKVLAFLLVIAVASSSKVSTRIEGGQITTINYYPSAVQIDSLLAIVWSQTCAGTVLTSRYILSAASCFSGGLYNARFRRVRAGSGERNQGGQVQYVEQAFNHPNFGQNGYDSDVTVVRLIEPLTYSSVVQQGVIISSSIDVPDYTPLTHIGWGASLDELASNFLQEVEVYAINNELCARAYTEIGRVITGNMICTGVLEGGRGACDRDAGGPVYYDENGTNIVVGINSFQEGCGNSSYPSVNTAVSPFTQWIIDTAN